MCPNSDTAHYQEVSFFIGQDNMEYIHFVSFLLNAFSWLVVGLVIGLRVHRMKRWKYNKTRFLFTTIAASGIGGLLAELANGSPTFGLSLINLFVAGFATVIAIFFAFPTYGKLIRALVRQEIQQLLQDIHVQYQSFRGK